MMSVLGLETYLVVGWKQWRCLSHVKGPAVRQLIMPWQCHWSCKQCPVGRVGCIVIVRSPPCHSWQLNRWVDGSSSWQCRISRALYPGWIHFQPHSTLRHFGYHRKTRSGCCNKNSGCSQSFCVGCVDLIGMAVNPEHVPASLNITEPTEPIVIPELARWLEEANERIVPHDIWAV